MIPTPTSDNSERLKQLNKMNQGQFNYMTSIAKTPSRQDYQGAVNAGMYLASNLVGNNETKIVNEGSEMRNGIKGNISTNDKDKTTKLLQARPFATTANLSKGMVPDMENDPNNRIGKNTRQFKKNLDLAGVEINRFIPLVPEVQRSIDYREAHINPVYWTRGGTSTRNFVRNSDYNKSCGNK